MKKKKSYDFFLTDNDGNLYKATSIDEKQFVLDEDEEVGEKKEEVVEEKKETKDEELVLSPEEIAFVKQLFAEHQAKQSEETVDEEVKEETKEEVVDTCQTNDSVKAFGSLEPTIEINDADAYAHQDEVAQAWANRIKKKED